MTPALYVHIPFCLKKCAYCDFFSVADLSLAEDFMEALVTEISMRAKGHGPIWPVNDHTRPTTRNESNVEPYRNITKEIPSLYLGGGTPSALPSSAIARILETVDRHWIIARDTEITCEINPGTVDRTYLEDLKHAGVNRLSIGVQSLDDQELAFLGRIHDKNQAVETIELAWKTGFENIGADLMYGIHPDSRPALEKTLKTAAAMPLTHLSCYMLTIEPGTFLYEIRKQMPGRFADSATKVDLLVQVSDFLQDQGFFHYEVSNFARGIQYCSRHNQGYWNANPYLGFGPSAHSFFPTDEQVRFWNVKNLAQYIALVRKGLFPVEETEHLNLEQQMTERIMLGLRTDRGIDLERFYQDFGRGYQREMEPLIQNMEAGKMGKKVRNQFALTMKGWTHLDHITEVFVNALQ